MFHSSEPYVNEDDLVLLEMEQANGDWQELYDGNESAGPVDTYYAKHRLLDLEPYDDEYELTDDGNQYHIKHSYTNSVNGNNQNKNKNMEQYSNKRIDTMLKSFNDTMQAENAEIGDKTKGNDNINRLVQRFGDNTKCNDNIMHVDDDGNDQNVNKKMKQQYSMLNTSEDMEEEEHICNAGKNKENQNIQDLVNQFGKNIKHNDDKKKDSNNNEDELEIKNNNIMDSNDVHLNKAQQNNTNKKIEWDTIEKIKNGHNHFNPAHKNEMTQFIKDIKSALSNHMNLEAVKMAMDTASICRAFMVEKNVDLWDPEPPTKSKVHQKCYSWFMSLKGGKMIINE